MRRPTLPVIDELGYLPLPAELDHTSQVRNFDEHTWGTSVSAITAMPGSTRRRDARDPLLDGTFHDAVVMSVLRRDRLATSR